jgi:transcription termination factor Rho
MKNSKAPATWSCISTGNFLTAGFPALDVKLSGTRREELLMSEKELKKMWLLRKVMDNYDPAEATEQLIERLKEFKTNKAFFESADVK